MDGNVNSNVYAAVRNERTAVSTVTEWRGRRTGHRQRSQSKMETTAGGGGNQVLVYNSRQFQHTQNPHSHA